MSDKVTFAPISSFTNDTTATTQTNANYVLMQNAIDNTLSRDGTTPNQMSSSLDMNNNHILNLSSPSSPNEPLRLVDVSVIPVTGISTNSVMVSALPSVSINKGARFMVSDATVVASGNFGAVVAGGGSNTIPVYSDGTNWRIG